MGSSTHAITDQNVSIEEIYNVILNKFDPTAKFHKDKNAKNDFTFDWGRIDFSFRGEDRDLSCGIFAKEVDNYDFVKNDKYLWISFGAWGNSTEIVKQIVVEFGGYIDENDCDDEEYYFFGKSGNRTIPPVIRVTRAEINEKFGAVVIITD